MSNVSITQLVNATTADANVVDTNFNAIVAQINGNLDATNIAPGAITNTLLASSIQPQTYLKSITTPYVISGLTVSTSGTLSTTVIGGTALINGKVVTVSGTPITVTASKDTYVDIKDDGTVNYTGGLSVANNASSPSLTLNSDGSNSLRIAKVISNGSTIVQVLQGAFNTAPVAPNTLNWFGFDSLGNPVYNTTSNIRTVGMTAIYSAASTTSATLIQSAFGTIPFVIPGSTPRRAFINYFGTALNSVSGVGVFAPYLDATVSGAQGNIVGQANIGPSAGGNNYLSVRAQLGTIAAGSHFINIGIETTAGTFNYGGSSTQPTQAWIEIE